MERFIAPIRNRYHEIMKNPEALQKTLAQGARKARAVAQKTLADVYNAIGFGY
jgi:tryptophanyl-tRNA synthetase